MSNVSINQPSSYFKRSFSSAISGIKQTYKGSNVHSRQTTKTTDYVHDLTKKLIKDMADQGKDTINDITNYSYYYVPEWLTVQFIVNNSISLAPLFSYGSTVYLIHKKQSSTGFSIDICCTMMVSSILRINFYFIRPFEYTLLKQAIIMIFIHIILLKVALSYKLQSGYDVDNLHNYESVITELKWFYFNEFSKMRVGGPNVPYLNFVNKEGFNTITPNADILQTRSRSGTSTFGSQNISFNKEETGRARSATISVINNETHNVNEKVAASSSSGIEENKIFQIVRLFIVLFAGTALIIFKNFVKFFDPYYKRSFEFWQWNNEKRYWLFLVEFAVISSTLTLMLRKYESYGSFIGSISLLIESLLPLPQILLLNRLKTINGFKTILLFSWYCGDLTKISYLVFGANNISFIFIFFALFQMFLDMIIGFQYVYYKYYYKVDYKESDIELQDTRGRRTPELVDERVL